MDLFSRGDAVMPRRVTDPEEQDYGTVRGWKHGEVQVRWHLSKETYGESPRDLVRIEKVEHQQAYEKAKSGDEAGHRERLRVGEPPEGK